MIHLLRQIPSTILLYLFFAAECSPAAQLPRVQNDVPAQLPNTAAVRAWAKQTVWGDASIEVLKSGGSEVIVVQRFFTSGVMSSGLCVFVRAGNHWEPGLLFRSAIGYRFDVVQKGDEVLLKNSVSGQEVARFSIKALGRDESGQAPQPQEIPLKQGAQKRSSHDH